MTTNTTGATIESAAETVADLCEDRELVVASNRQPYSHYYEDGDAVSVDRPAGGLTAALDPVMQAAEGTWVAWGDGDADREVVGPDDTVAVPPEDPAYDLARVWLTDEQVEGYYRGYSNQVLWPLCHLDTAKMNPREEFWREYRETNADFADAILDSTDGAGSDPVVWFQDYHLALAPRRVRDARPDAFLAHFWHIPWPSRDVFRACPQYEQLLDGLLANDLVGFHTEDYCRNFLDCVEAATDARVDRASGSVSYRGHRTFVRSFPLGIDASRQADLAESDEADEWWAEFRDAHGIDPSDTLAVGVERLDYTKGIEQRLAALERFWADNPERRGEFTYVQKGTESRSGIEAYDRLQDRVAAEIERINDRFGTDDWTPVIYTTDHLPEAAIAALYREADLGLVTPVRDGMNLVAKEYVAAQTRDPGVLVLSELAGATDQLGDEAVLVHPYDTPGFADGIAEALSLSLAERRTRIADLQREVHAKDVYEWLESTFETAAAVERGRRSLRQSRPSPTDD
ncbi:trehalose-6-phosphate synthase [Halorussus sp. MSC15.2]|uniref:alpha,alpha-trehalose-phosphate synthase (UDP-forming) n=1 Tax=Halorussus sp. MSC15.2 TaxID=2283638 RepID=UPI0013D27531|nr:trehalose-6-phosphate synthase [Halorussus sp. MSC15.2]NEU58954.1 trehalose-6-phosphate synthase [Halorussus sp. MSC15.2]